MFINRWMDKEDVHTHTHNEMLCVCQLLSRVWLCNPMDCSPPGSSVHRILQARILEPVAISFSRRSSWPRDRAWVSCIAGGFFTIWATRQAQWKGKFALFQKLKTVQRPTPLTDNQWARAFRSRGRGYVKEQHSQLWSSWNWSSVVWPMSFWLF